MTTTKTLKKPYLFLALWAISLVSVLACQPLPKKRLNQFETQLSYEVKGDSLYVSIGNSIHCPLRVGATSQNEEINSSLSEDFPLVLTPFADSLLTYPIKDTAQDINIRFSATMGDPAQNIQPSKISLPIKAGGKSKIIQGYKGNYSHNSTYSRYAIDFKMSIGDTIYAAENAWVVGVIEGYKHGGSNRKWRDYANFITLYHPESNIYTQYVHLDHMGSLVSVGDKVQKGEAIGISGMTGFTDQEHLHFNVLKPIEKGMASIEIEFEEGYLGKDLKRGHWVKKPIKKVIPHE